MVLVCTKRRLGHKLHKAGAPLEQQAPLHYEHVAHPRRASQHHPTIDCSAVWCAACGQLEGRQQSTPPRDEDTTEGRKAAQHSQKYPLSNHLLRETPNDPKQSPYPLCFNSGYFVDIPLASTREPQDSPATGLNVETYTPPTVNTRLQPKNSLHPLEKHYSNGLPASLKPARYNTAPESSAQTMLPT